MDSKIIPKEFSENLKMLDLLNNNFENEGKKSILMLKVKDVVVVFKIAEKEKIWVKQYDYVEFMSYKNKMGFDGTWKAFFKTIELAVNKKSGGDIQMKYSKDNLQILHLTLYHPLSDELKVKSDIIFEKFYSFKNDYEEFKNHNYDVLLELYQSKEVLKEMQKLQALSPNHSNNIKNESNSVNSSNFKAFSSVSNSEIGNKKLEVKKNLKRKFNSDLINPNIKKRKGRGAKLISENDEFEEDSKNDD